MTKLKAVLNNLPAAPEAEKARLESLFLSRLENEFGGMQKLAQAYRDWIDADAKPPPLEIDVLTHKIRWEAAFDKASCNILNGLDVDASSSFFILHYL